jgi:dTDP-4-dehydrorhamnose 3,5-epimerase-like enzyme
MKSVKLIKLPFFEESDGDLTVAEGESEYIQFSVARVFNVRAHSGSIRGRHAHRKCTQLLICSNGAIKVYCDDNNTTLEYLLDKPNYGLLILPGVWSEQRYIEDNTVLTVLCDQKYREDDYIRDLVEFRSYTS